MRRIITSPISFILIVVLSLCGCTKQDDVREIRKLIKQGAGLAEKKDIKGLVKLTTEDFSAQPGDLDRLKTKRILWWAFRHYGDFKIMYPQPSVDLESDHRGASAMVAFLIVKRDRSLPNLKELYEDPKGWLEEVGDRTDLYRLELELLKEKGEWLVRGTRLEAFRGFRFGE